jgi:hypothetical protein
MSLIENAHSGDLFVHEVTFLDEGFVLKYVEFREQSDSVAIEKAMLLEASTEERQIIYDRIQTDLQWLIDDGLVELRNPEA